MPSTKPTIDPDEQLLASWTVGDRDAGKQLFERHFARIYRFFRRRTDRSEAEELTQRTFATCTSACANPKEVGNFRVFLLGIARHVLYAAYRERANRPGFEANAKFAPAPVTAPDERAERGEQRRILLRAIRSLPLDLQLTLELHYWEDLSTADIASVMDVPRGTVKWRLSRARELLRERIESMPLSEVERTATLASLEGWLEAMRRNAAARG